MMATATRLACSAALLVAASLPLGQAVAEGPEIPAREPPNRTAGIQVPAERIDMAIGRLDGLATDLLRRSGIPGMAVAVVRDGSTVYVKGFGVRRQGAPEAVDGDTVFQLASLSKPLGATVIASQVGKGVVDWDTRVADHLPWFALADPWVTAHLTVGDLYAHRSGLPAHAGDDLEDLGFDRRTVLERLRLLPLAPFRSSYAYTNFGLTAGAEAVAAAAGTDWASLSEAAVYGPLGMTRTSSRFADFIDRENRAAGHIRSGDGFAALHVRQPDAQSPAGGVSSTARDMAKWMAMVLQDGAVDGRQVVAAEALLPAVTPKVITGQPRSVDARPGLYGFGFGIGIEPSGRVSLSHSGGFALGAGTKVEMIPSLGLGIVVLTNALPFGVAEALAAEFADLVQYGAITRDWLAGYGGLLAPITAPFGSRVDVAPPAQPAPALPAAAYAGSYGNAYFGPLTVAEEGGALVLTIGPKAMRFPLRHWDGNSFVFTPGGENAPEGSLSAVDFVQDDKGNVSEVRVEFLDGAGLGSFRRP